jgi:hypothetical protein
MLFNAAVCGDNDVDNVIYLESSLIKRERCVYSSSDSRCAACRYVTVPAMFQRDWNFKMGMLPRNRLKSETDGCAASIFKRMSSG